MYCMIRSENDFKKFMRKSIFRTDHTYHNCLLESSHLESPSVLTLKALGFFLLVQHWEGVFSTPSVRLDTDIVES